MRKGQIEAIHNTIILAIVLAILVIAMLLIWALKFIFTGDPRSSQSFELVAVHNKPYVILQGLVHSLYKDRLIKEHILEASVVGSLNAAQSQDLELRIKEILDFYNLKYYRVILQKGDKTILEIDNTLRKCGANDEGYCVSTGRVFKSGCGIGSREIDDADKCRRYEVCCQEEVDSSGNYPKIDSQGREVITCGESEGVKGVCDDRPRCQEGRVFVPGQGRVLFKGCPLGTANKPMACCAPIKQAAEAEIGSLNKAEIPLLYKQPSQEKLFPVSYCIADASKCPGETARGMCTIAGALCCVTSLIPCQTATFNGYCLDIQRCDELSKPNPARREISKDCPQSAANTFQCCLIDASKIKTASTLQPTDLGKCNFPQPATEEEIPKITLVVGQT